MKSKETIERIYVTREDLTRVENEVRFQEHLKRYAAVRRFIYGSVLDFACGCGYGTYILAVNPEVSEIIGVDLDEHAIEWANANFSHPKIQFQHKDVGTIRRSFDTLYAWKQLSTLKMYAP